MSVRNRVRRAVSASAGSQVLNVLIQLVSVPAFLSVWGIQLYGEWLILSSFLAFLALSDLGFSKVAANEMTIAVGNGRREHALEIFQSMLCLLVAVCVLLALASLCFVYLGPSLSGIGVKTISDSDSRWIVVGLTGTVTSSLLLGLLIAGYRCDGHFAEGIVAGTAIRGLAWVAQMATLYATESPRLVAFSGFGISFLCLVPCFRLLRRYSPWLNLGFEKASVLTIRSLLKPALAQTAFPVGTALNNQGVLQIIGLTLGPVVLANFSVHRTVANIGIQIINLINQSVAPEISRAYGEKNSDLLRNLHRQACRYAIWLSAIGGLITFALLPFAIPLWTKGAVAWDYKLSIVLMVLVVTRSFWLTSSVVPSATNRHVRIATVFLSCALLSLPFVYLAASRLGILFALICLAATEIAMGYFVSQLSMRLTDDTARRFVSIISRPPPLPGIFRVFIGMRQT